MLLYSELLDAYEKLKKENAELKAEIARLSGTVVSENSCEGEVVCPQNAAVDKFSSSQEKINLFRSLFVGREDIFAKRWHSKTTGKSGYQPVCGNEWDEILCDKRKYKCSTCPNRKLLPLSDKDIFNHLAGKDEYGRDIVGIYPMLSDETCNFCCTDFDDEGYEEAAKAFYSVCAEYDIPAYIERSRSGSGAHIWIFFSSPVKAKTARQFVSSVLTAAMERCSRIAFSSYDRMFPNQDNMPSGGFGNLIALPLQGKVRKNGNSVFVNTDFVPYKDQWAFLSSVRRVNEDLINDIISKLCKKNELGILMSESEEKPWHTVQKSVSAFDFPRELKITISNMIYIPKEKLKSTAINSIKRLAAFKNPDFYRTQAMCMSVYNKPRIICLAEDFDEYIAIPRGCKNALCELFESAQVNYCFVDETNSGNPIDICFNGELREEQRPAAQALLSESTGVLSATTAFGKTVVGAYLIAQKK